MAKITSSRRKPVQPKIRSSSENCFFCKKKITPDYKEYQTLEKFVTDRGKIVGKSRTGVCTKHQRRLGIAIKRARYIALIPYAPGI